MMQWGMTSLIGHRDSFEHCCRYASRLGYGFIELNCVRDYFSHFNPLQLADSPETLRRIRDVLAESGLRCSAVDCHGLFARQPEGFAYSCDALRAGFEIASALGSPVVATSIPGGGAPWEKMVSECAGLCREAADRGLTVAVEAEYHFAVGTPDELERFLACVDSPNLAVNFDPSHFVRAGYDIAETLRRFDGRIAHVHLKEYLPASAHPTRFTGEEGSPASQMLDELRRLGYSGVASAETLAELDVDGEAAASEIMAGIRRWEQRIGGNL